MRRRAFMGIAGSGLVALTGCLTPGTSEERESPPANKPTQTANLTPTVTTDADRAVSVTIQSLQLQYGLVTPSSPDSIGIDSSETAYLMASVRVDGALSRDEFVLTMGDVGYTPTKIDRLYRTSWGEDQWDEEGRKEGLVSFEAPQPATDHLQLKWPGGSRTISESILSRLSEEPPPMSASLAVPNTHHSTEAPAVPIEVTNEGETPGRFLGALNRVGPLIASAPVARLSGLVPAGETVSLSVSDTWTGTPPEEVIGDQDPELTYHLHYSSGKTTAAIRISEPA